MIGHTSSTQDAVAEGEIKDLESWAEDYARESNNYGLAKDINHILEKQQPENMFYRIHPKFLRTLSGKPRDIPFIRCATNICPGDIGPSRVIQASGNYRAVFSRHPFNTKDVFLRNVTARVDRNAIFTTPLTILINDFDNVKLTVKFAGKSGVFQKPDVNSTLCITSNAIDWNIKGLRFYDDTKPDSSSSTALWSATLGLATIRDTIPPTFLNASRGLVAWTNVRLEQPVHNAPLMVGLNLAISRQCFSFPVNRSWPHDRLDVTNNPADGALEWPEETFEFATTAGQTTGALQKGGSEISAGEITNEPGRWVWKVPLDRVWTDPRQACRV